MRNFTRDEEGSFAFGNQVLMSDHREMLWVKGPVNVAESREQTCLVERGKRKRTAGCPRVHILRRAQSVPLSRALDLPAFGVAFPNIPPE